MGERCVYKNGGRRMHGAKEERGGRCVWQRCGGAPRREHLLVIKRSEEVALLLLGRDARSLVATRAFHLRIDAALYFAPTALQ